MAFSPNILRKLQLGVEPTPGVVTPATKHLSAFSLSDEPQLGVTPIDTMGNKYSVGVTVDKEHTKLSATGDAGINDLCYIFDSLFYHTTPGGGQFAWTPSSFSPDTFTTYTAEMGDNVNNVIVPGVYFDACSLTFPPNGKIGFTAEAMGKQLQDNDGTVTPLTTATDVPLRVLSPRGTGIYVAPDLASLSAAPLLTDLTATWSMSGARGMVFTNDPNEPSYSGTVDTRPKLSGSFVMPMGSAARTTLAAARNGDGFFIRYVNSHLVGGVTYVLEIIQSASYDANPAARGDTQGLYAATFPWSARDSSDLGGAVKITITTDMTSL